MNYAHKGHLLCHEIYAVLGLLKKCAPTQGADRQSESARHTLDQLHSLILVMSSENLHYQCIEVESQLVPLRVLDVVLVDLAPHFKLALGIVPVVGRPCAMRPEAKVSSSASCDCAE